MENLSTDYAKGLIDAFKFNHTDNMFKGWIIFLENGCKFSFNDDLQQFVCELRYENDLGEDEYKYDYLIVDEKCSIKGIQKFIENNIEEYFKLNS